MLALFGLFASIGLDASAIAFFVGFLSLCLWPVGPALFGLGLCIAYNAPWWVYVIGFICLMVDIERD